MSVTRLGCVLALGCAFCVGGTASAQKRTEPTLVETVQVSVVNVEVFVTDRDGKPKRGLRREDFTLFEDGKPVEITNFYASEAVLAMEGGASPAEAAAPVEVPASPQAALIPEEQGLTVVLFVDSLNTTVRQRRPVIEQLERFLNERLRPDDRAMVVSYDTSLRVRSPLSTNREAVLAALREVGREMATADSLHRDRQDILVRMMEPMDPEARRPSPINPMCIDGDPLNPETCHAVEAFSERLYRLNRGLIDALVGNLDALAGVPGRKAMVFVSTGIPVHPAEDLFIMAWLRPKRFTNLGNELGRIGLRANAGRVSFYPVNARGDQEISGLNASNELSRFLAEHMFQQLVIQADQIDFSQRQETLTDFAVGTGGRSLIASPGLGNALGQLVDDFGAFYSLGFSPEHFGDGRYYRLDVRVNVPGARVRHREGYLDKTDAQRLADRNAGALLIAPTRNTLSMRVATEPAEKLGNRFKLPLTVTVPAGELTLVPGADGSTQEGRVTISIVARNRGGQASESHSDTFPIRVPADALPSFLQGSTTFSFELMLRKGEHKVAVTARDDIALNEGTVTIDVEVQ